MVAEGPTEEILRLVVGTRLVVPSVVEAGLTGAEELEDVELNVWE